MGRSSFSKAIPCCSNWDQGGGTGCSRERRRAESWVALPTLDAAHPALVPSPSPAHEGAAGPPSWTPSQLVAGQGPMCWGDLICVVSPSNACCQPYPVLPCDWGCYQSPLLPAKHKSRPSGSAGASAQPSSLLILDFGNSSQKTPLQISPPSSPPSLFPLFYFLSVRKK